MWYKDERGHQRGNKATHLQMLVVFAQQVMQLNFDLSFNWSDLIHYISGNASHYESFKSGSLFS